MPERSPLYAGSEVRGKVTSYGNEVAPIIDLFRRTHSARTMIALFRTLEEIERERGDLGADLTSARRLRAIADA